MVDFGVLVFVEVRRFYAWVCVELGEFGVEYDGCLGGVGLL